MSSQSVQCSPNNMNNLKWMDKRVNKNFTRQRGSQLFCPLKLHLGQEQFLMNPTYHQRDTKSDKPAIECEGEVTSYISRNPCNTLYIYGIHRSFQNSQSIKINFVNFNSRLTHQRAVSYRRTDHEDVDLNSFITPNNIVRRQYMFSLSF